MPLDLLRRLSRIGVRVPTAPTIQPLPTSGEYITQIAGGANLVGGHHTWELADHRHDLATMQRCCEAELNSMALGGEVAAPFYFERVAILFRKAGNYQGEVELCERYIEAVERFYSGKDMRFYADVRAGGGYPMIVHRLQRARILAAKAGGTRTSTPPATE